jgi:hypothetical protein
MKHAVYITEQMRPVFARRALEIFEAHGARREGLQAVETELNVSTPDARSLISHGRVLRRQEQERAA